MVPNRREFLANTGFVGATALAGDFSAVRNWLEHASTLHTQQQVRLIRTSVLEIGYEQTGDDSAFPIILLHGFPYDARSWDGVVPTLSEAGYRVLVPYLRGYGPTRFLDPSAPRMAEQAAIGQDVIDFADALGLERFALAGFDWGVRAACIASILHPERVRAFVAIGGYSVQNTLTLSSSGSPESAARAWYQWYFNTESGRLGLEANRRGICRYLWETWSPAWRFTDDEYNRTAVSFDNPDFVDVVIHSYRHRVLNAPGEERFVEIERHLAERPPIQVPTIVLRGFESGFGRPSLDPSGDQDRFPRLVARRIVQGAGHNLPYEAPEAVSNAFVELLA